MSAIKEAMIEVVSRIPYGHVTWFGAVAEVVREMTRTRITAQVIGRQLSGLPRHERQQLPWWRVIAKNWYVSTLKLWDKWREQIELLKKEWVEIDQYMVDMEIYSVDAETLKHSKRAEK